MIVLDNLTPIHIGRMAAPLVAGVLPVVEGIHPFLVGHTRILIGMDSRLVLFLKIFANLLTNGRRTISHLRNALPYRGYAKTSSSGGYEGSGSGGMAAMLR